MKRLFCLVSAMMAALLIAGCGGGEKKKEGVRIVTSFFPMYVATINITDGVEGVTVSNMTAPQTGCLHDYQLSVEDMKRLEDADVFVVNGGGMENFLTKVAEAKKKLQIVEAAKGIPMLKDAEGTNPHLWVGISCYIQQVQNIADQLVKADAKHADQYKKNAEAYIAKLNKLKQDMHAKIDPLTNRKIVTFHEAFPYMAQEFKLEIVDVVEREPGTEPTPQELEALIKQVKSLPVKVLFAEPQYSPAAAETVARETGAKIYQLDPCVTGEAKPENKDAYLKSMAKNADVLAEALK
ncbi:MAG: metal ABC transporter substrate-binding protein [Selenomonadaceae bacterium]|nr:metal ABC transporter substrate-binding protein [Selenomonadaceae bacterium]